MRDRAMQANATMMKTTVYWFNTAPRRPGNAANPFDPAYRWEDLDEFVRQAADHDIEVMLTIWGTPTWAGPAKNRLPRRLADLQNFSARSRPATRAATTATRSSASTPSGTSRTSTSSSRRSTTRRSARPARRSTRSSTAPPIPA